MAYTRADLQNTAPAASGSPLGFNEAAFGLNIDDLTYHLNLALKEPSPRNFIDAFFKSRKATMTQSRIDDLCALVEKARQANQTVVQAKGELLISAEMVKHTMQMVAIRANQDKEYLQRQHQDEIQQIVDRGIARQLTLEQISILCASIRAQIKELESRASINEAIAERIRNNQLSGPDIANILANMGGAKTDIAEELATLSKRLEILDQEITIKRYEGKIKEAEAKQAHVQAHLDAEGVIRETGKPWVDDWKK